MNVLTKEETDGSLRVTVTVGDNDHRFDVSSNRGVATISYEETLSWRGYIRVSRPEEKVFRAAMTSDEVTDYLDRNGLSTIRRTDERNS
jgi:hypothetical protein